MAVKEKAADVRAFSPEHVLEMAAKLRVQSYRMLGKNLETFYRKYFEKCLSDRVLTPAEKETLAHLKAVLGLSDKLVARIHNEVAEAVYRKNVDEIIADGKISAEERSFLKSVQEELRLPDHVAQRIYAEEASNLIGSFISKIVSDRRLSPDEEKEIQEIARSLGAKVEYEESTQQILDKYRLYWLIENAELPVLKTEVKLQKNEICHYSVEGTWFEPKTKSKKTHASGFTGRRHIIHGAYHKQKGEVPDFDISAMQTVDRGRIFLTNKRLYFAGTKKKSIRLSGINDFHPYLNGIQIHAKTQESPFLQFDHGVDVFSLILFRLLRESA